jgi:hypothetical protein
VAAGGIESVVGGAAVVVVVELVVVELVEVSAGESVEGDTTESVVEGDEDSAEIEVPGSAPVEQAASTRTNPPIRQRLTG